MLSGGGRAVNVLDVISSHNTVKNSVLHRTGAAGRATCELCRCENCMQFDEGCLKSFGCNTLNNLKFKIHNILILHDSRSLLMRLLNSS